MPRTREGGTQEETLMTQAAYPIVARPVDFYYDGERYNNTGYFKWKRDSLTSYYYLERCATFDGTFALVTDGKITTPASGTWVSFRDVDVDPRSFYYRLRAQDGNLNYSRYAGPIKPGDTSSECIVKVYVKKSNGAVYTGENRPIVKLVPEDADKIFEFNSAKIYSTEKNVGVRCEEKSGYAELTVLRSSAISNLKYKLTIIIGGEPITETGITIPDQAEVWLNDLVTWLPAA